MFGPYAGHGGFKGCGILVHAQLSYWEPGNQRLKNLFFEVVPHIWGVCYFKAKRCGVRLPPAGQNPEKVTSFCEHMYQLLCPAASGGSDSRKITSFDEYPRHHRCLLLVCIRIATQSFGHTRVDFNARWAITVWSHSGPSFHPIHNLNT